MSNQTAISPSLWIMQVGKVSSVGWRRGENQDLVGSRSRKSRGPDLQVYVPTPCFLIKFEREGDGKGAEIVPYP